MGFIQGYRDAKICLRQNGLGRRNHRSPNCRSFRPQKPGNGPYPRQTAPICPRKFLVAGCESSTSGHPQIRRPMGDAIECPLGKITGPLLYTIFMSCGCFVEGARILIGKTVENGRWSTMVTSSHLILAGSVARLVVRPCNTPIAKLRGYHQASSGVKIFGIYFCKEGEHKSSFALTCACRTFCTPKKEHSST